MTEVSHQTVLLQEIASWAGRYRRAVEGQPYTAEYIRGAVHALVCAAVSCGSGEYRELRSWADELMGAGVRSAAPRPAVPESRPREP